jgi:hypothetical protein
MRRKRSSTHVQGGIVELNYFANPTFQGVHAALMKYMFIRGPVGSGKSSGCIWHCMLNAMQQPVQKEPDGTLVRRSRYGILRATYPALKTTVVKSWQLWFKNLINIVYDTPIRGELKLPHPDGVSTIIMELIFIALDREEDVNKLQSLELTGAHLNEAAEIPRAVHQMLKSRINRYPEEREGGASFPFIICDYNSVPTDHWLYSIAEEEQPPGHLFYHQPPALLMVKPGESDLIDVQGNAYIINPDADNLGHFEPGAINKPPTVKSTYNKETGQWYVPHLAADYYIDQVLGAEADWVSVMIMNSYGELRSGKPVYAEYQDGVHFNDKMIDPMPGVPIIIGMDLGLTPAAAFMQLTPTGTLNVFDEIVTEDCSIQAFCDDHLKPHLINNYPKFNFELLIDPSAGIRSQNDAKSAAEIIKGCGLSYRHAKTNNPIKRREAVIYFLRRLDGFSVGPKCAYIRKGFISEFKFERKRLGVMNVRSSNADMFKEKWEKNIYSHIHEAVQYGAIECSEGKTGKKRKSKPKKNAYNQPADSTSGY